MKYFTASVPTEANYYMYIYMYIYFQGGGSEGGRGVKGEVGYGSCS